MKHILNKLNSRFLLSIFTIILLVLFFCFPVASLDGAKNGLLLWFNIVLPTLLPFIIVSNLIIYLNLTSYIGILLYPLFYRIFHVSRAGCFSIIVGILTGYPVGAKSCGDLVKKNKIDKSEGQYLLALCNNASPMFITSFIATQTLELESYRYIILMIIYISAFVSSYLYRLIRPITLSVPEPAKVPPINVTAVHTETFQLLDEAIMNAFEVLTKVGGYIIIFSILAEIISNISIPSMILKLIIMGLLEITSGIYKIGSASIDMAIKIVLIITITAFGGISSIAQTKSVIDETGLSIKTYIGCKLCNALIALLLSLIFVTFCSF